VSLAAIEASQTRYLKDPATKVVTSSSLPTSHYDAVTVAVIAGTPSATPAAPATPADSGSSYVIPLAYVRVPNGAGEGSGSAIAARDILDACNVLPLSRVTGAATMRASSTNAALSAAQLAAWANGSHRPGHHAPASMVGAESRIIMLDLLDASSSNWSHASDGIVDDSIDWRNRFFKWRAYADTGTASFVSDPGAGVIGRVPVADGSVPGSTNASGVGQSFADDVAASKRGALYVAQTGNMTVLAGATTVRLYVDATDGALRVLVSGAPLVKLWVWLDASAPFANA
jgi:hypothetical protein